MILAHKFFAKLKYNLFKEWLIPLTGLILVSIIFCMPIFSNFSYWGQMDWDQFTFWNAIPRDTIFRYHQFPLWNPYANGGSVLLAHPHSSFLSPFYIFVLLFGVIIGLKLQIVIHLFIGMLGMFLLSKQIGLNKYSCYVPPLVFMLSSIYPLHMTEGHAGWLPMAFLPWAIWALLKSEEDKRYIAGGIFFISLMYFAGSVDVLSITIPLIFIFSIMQMWCKRNGIFFKNIIAIFVGVLLLSSIKFLPMLEFVSKNPRLDSPSEGINLSLIPTILTSRNQADLYLQSRSNFHELKKNLEIDEGWHEYGAYMGLIPLMLFLGGVFGRFKKNWPLLLCGLLFLLIALGSNSKLNLWHMLRRLPFYSGLSCPSRFILGFVFFASLIAGSGFSLLESAVETRGSLIKLIIPAILLVILLDLHIVNSPIFDMAFGVSPLEVKRNIEFKQRFHGENFYGHISRSSMYPVFLGNSGILDSYEVISLKKGNVLTSRDPDYKGEAYLVGSEGTASVTYFSPNRLGVDVNVAGDSVLVLNQNYYGGWRVIEEGRVISADSLDGLIAAPVNSKTKNVIFYYLPTSFLLGGFISLLSFFWIFLLQPIKRFRKRCSMRNET